MDTLDTNNLLTEGVKAGASDIMLVAGAVPMMRVNGEVRVLPNYSGPRLTNDITKDLLYKIFTPMAKAKFEQNWESDFSHNIPGVSRFRVNVFIQRFGISAVFRTIPTKIPDPKDLGITPEMIALADLPRGLVLVTGPTGSGKSTTLACIMELVNQRHKKSILTIEDPVEFVYESKSSLIMQREVGQHTKSFQHALRSALRQAPDVILVGEMRDTETISLAITAAETGHLCFGTLHTQSCAATIDRIIDVFPAEQQPQIRTQLAMTLKAVLAQVLIPKKVGTGRIAVREFMVMTAAIGSLIREGKPHMIPSSIETGKELGMMTMDQALARALAQDLITEENAKLKATSPTNVITMSKMIKSGSIPA